MEKNISTLPSLTNLMRKTDQAVTMHSILSQRYSNFSTLTSVIIWFGSAILLMATFFDPQVLAGKTYQITAQDLRLVTASLGGLIFLASLLPLLLSWDRKAAEHYSAARSFGQLKYELRRAKFEQGSENFSRVLFQYSRVTETACQIPESQFLKLKKAHMMKKALSKYLPLHPVRPYFLTLWCFYLSNTFKSRPYSFWRDAAREESRRSRINYG